MHHDELSARERAVLFALLAAARKLSNSEARGADRNAARGQGAAQAQRLKLVESERPGREFVHELSDAGWRWCAEELAAGLNGRGTILERSLYLVLGMFERYMTAARLSLADVATLDVKARPRGRHKRRDTAEGNGDLTARVRGRATPCSPRALARFVKLRELREHLATCRGPPSTPCSRRCSPRGASTSSRSADQQALTAVDREAALRLGGEHKHLISIE